MRTRYNIWRTSSAHVFSQLRAGRQKSSFYLPLLTPFLFPTHSTTMSDPDSDQTRLQEEPIASPTQPINAVKNGDLTQCLPAAPRGVVTLPLPSLSTAPSSRLSRASPASSFGNMLGLNRFASPRSVFNLKRYSGGLCSSLLLPWLQDGQAVSQPRPMCVDWRLTHSQEFGKPKQPGQSSSMGSSAYPCVPSALFRWRTRCLSLCLSAFRSRLLGSEAGNQDGTT